MERKVVPGTPAPPDCTFQVLGPLTVTKNGKPVHLPAGRQQVVLAMLLLDANRVVSLEQLIDAVWDIDPPATARVQIQICVSSLRRLLYRPGQADAIVTRQPGYQLAAATEALDAASFEALVADADRATEAGDPARAAARLRAALALFRGTVLDGVPSGAVQAKATRLEERRLQILERCLDLELRLDRHRELVGELRDLVTEHPLQERLRGFLMVALHRSGRTSEALEVYRQGRRELIEELGLEPGPELRRLEKEILAEDVEDESAAPQPEPQSPRQLPMDIADFTGRAEALAMIDALVSTEESTAMPIAVLTGRGGVGKSVLAVHAAHRLQAMWFPDGQLYVDLRGTGSVPVAPGVVLSRFLRSLGLPGAAIPQEPEERADMYRTLLADRRVLIVLDDAGDEKQVLPLLPGSPSCMVLVTSRSLLAGLPGARLLTLDELDEDTAIDLLARIAGSERVRAEQAAARRLVHAVGGLPLALRVLGARLSARSHWSLSMMADRLLDERGRLDELTYGDLGVRSSLALTVDPLPGEARRLLRRLAGLEHALFPEWFAAAVLDTGVRDGIAVLDQLVEAQLVDYAGRDSAGNPRYRCHELVRLYAKELLLDEETGAEQEATIRRLTGCWLALFDEAHRRVYGGDFTRPRGGGHRWQLDRAYVNRLLASPLTWMDHMRAEALAAMRQAGEHGLDEECWELTVCAVTLFESRSYFDDWQESHEQALAVTQRAGNVRGEAAVLCSLASLEINRQQVVQSRALLGHAIELFDRAGDVHGEAMAYRNLATLDRMQGALDDAMDRFDRAGAGFREAGDPIGEAHVLTSAAQVHLLRPDYAEAERLLRQALRICREVGSRRVESQAVYYLGVVAMHRGELESAERSLWETLAMVRNTGDRLGEWHALSMLGEVRGRVGDHEQALKFLFAAIEVCQQTGDLMGEARVRLSLTRLLLSLGKRDQAVRSAEWALDMFRRHHADPMVAEAEELIAEIQSASRWSSAG